MLVSKQSSITELSAFARLLGVVEIRRTSLIKNKAVFSLHAHSIKLNGIDVNLNKAQFELTLLDSTLTVISLSNQNEKFSIRFNKRMNEITYVEKSFDLKNKSTDDLSKDEQAMLSQIICIYTELTNPNIVRKAPKSDNNQVLASCYYVASSFRYTKSSSVGHLNAFVDSYLASHKDCHKVFGVDSGCLWGDYGCVSTQEIHCHGASCN